MPFNQGIKYRGLLVRHREQEKSGSTVTVCYSILKWMSHTWHLSDMRMCWQDKYHWQTSDCLNPIHDHLGQDSAPVVLFHMATKKSTLLFTLRIEVIKRTISKCVCQIIFITIYRR